MDLRRPLLLTGLCALALWTPGAWADDPASAGTVAPPVDTAPPPLTDPAATPPDPAPVDTAASDTVITPPVDAPPPAEDDNASIARARREHLRVYEWTRPNWGLQFTGTANALGGEDIGFEQNGHPIRGLAIQAEWQPEWIQAIGVLGIGPSAALYPISAAGGVVPSSDMGISFASNWAVGAQARYQLRFFHEQPIVPEAGYLVEYLRYHLPSSGPSGGTLLSGPFFGAMIFLNFLEPTVAAENYVTNGIARTYLVAELRMLVGGDGNIEVGGKSYFFGLRFEF